MKEKLKIEPFVLCLVFYIFFNFPAFYPVRNTKLELSFGSGKIVGLLKE